MAEGTATSSSHVEGAASLATRRETVLSACNSCRRAKLKVRETAPYASKTRTDELVRL